MAENIVQVKGRFSYKLSPGICFSKDNSQSVSRTKQSFKKEADINCIMAKYSKTGVLVDPSRIPTRMPQFGDFSSVVDYQGLCNKKIEVDNYFMSLPASVRQRFDNDVNKLIAFMADEKNVDEALKLGLVDNRLSDVRYIDTVTGEDITQRVIDERGLFVKGKRVNKDGSPYKKPEAPGVGGPTS